MTYDLEKELRQASVIEDELRSGAFEILKADEGRCFPLDLLVTAAINRSLFLFRGIRQLIEDRNLVCVGALLRLQLDTVVRFGAATLVDDPHQFALDVIGGKHIRKIKDRNGTPMTDRHLVEVFSANAPWMKGVYEKTSGYIHFSDSHIFQTVSAQPGEKKFTFQIGGSLPSKYDPLLAEALAAFNECGRMLLNLLVGWCLTKIRAGEARNEGQETVNGETSA